MITNQDYSSHTTMSATPAAATTETSHSESAPVAKDDVSQNTETKPEERVSTARVRFDEYLHRSKHKGHFLDVTSPNGPVRRADIGAGTAVQGQHIVTSQKYKWNESKCCWTSSKTRSLVSEDCIYDTILSFQRVMDKDCHDTIHDCINARFQGVLTEDVRVANTLWRLFKLWDVDATNDALWNGHQRAAIGACL